MCHPCVRTGVTHLSGPYTLVGERALRVSVPPWPPFIGDLLQLPMYFA